MQYCCDLTLTNTWYARNEMDLPEKMHALNAFHRIFLYPLCVLKKTHSLEENPNSVSI